MCCRGKLIVQIQLVLMLMTTNLMAGSEDWRIVLCISEDPMHAMNVAWRDTVNLENPLVQYTLNKPEAKFYQQALENRAEVEVVHLPEGGQVYAYSADMDGLEPGTSYAYRVGNDRNWSEWFVFRTAESSPRPFRFLYFGDPQNGLTSHVSRALRAGYKEAPDAAFLTMAGDLVSVPDIDKQWEDLFHAGSFIFGHVPQAPLMGNHAYYVGRKWTKSYSDQWRPHFNLPENGLHTLPETNYFFHYQGVLFIALNGSEQLEEQALWLDMTLSNQKSRWVIVSIHQPLYATGQGRDGTKRREAFLETIDKYEVDLVLQGHDHTFGRTFPLKGGKAVNKRQKGTVYINSVSGSKQYKLGPPQGEVFEVTDSDKQFYHVIAVDTKQLKMSSFTVDGQLKDEVIIKPSNLR